VDTYRPLPTQGPIPGIAYRPEEAAIFLGVTPAAVRRAAGRRQIPYTAPLGKSGIVRDGFYLTAENINEIFAIQRVPPVLPPDHIGADVSLKKGPSSAITPTSDFKPLIARPEAARKSRRQS
jgi:hypothetical protein